MTRHSNVVRSVIIGKKSWGLWMGQWTDGISDFLFRKVDIVDEFVSREIDIPENLMREFDNLIERKHRNKFGDNKEFIKRIVENKKNKQRMKKLDTS